MKRCAVALVLLPGCGLFAEPATAEKAVRDFYVTLDTAAPAIEGLYESALLDCAAQHSGDEDRVRCLDRVDERFEPLLDLYEQAKALRCMAEPEHPLCQPAAH